MAQRSNWFRSLDSGESFFFLIFFFGFDDELILFVFNYILIKTVDGSEICALIFKDFKILFLNLLRKHKQMIGKTFPLNVYKYFQESTVVRERECINSNYK